jgi:tetratricopeptide (TPR) repeat protein
VLEEAWLLAPDDRQRLATVEVLGQAYLDAGQWRGAESAFLQVLALSQVVERPDAAIRAHNGRGEALRRGGRLQEAMACFQKVIEVLGPLKAPNSEQSEQAGVALHNLGVLLLEERPDAALAMLQQAIKCFVGAYGTSSHPHVARATAFIGRHSLLAGDPAAAEERFKEALRLVPLAHPIAQELVPMLRRPV